MQDHKLRAIAATFLKEHRHPKLGKKVEFGYECAHHIVTSLLRHGGKKELLRLYPLMSKDLKQGFLYWFPSITHQLTSKFGKIDRRYHYIRDNWQYRCECCLESEVEDYFKKLGSVVLVWLKGGKK